MNCPKCGKEIAGNYRFCSECGTPVPQKTPQQDVNVIKNKALWDIHPGEIARKISETDFVNLSTVSGIVVQPGVTAIVYINGHEVSQINSGIYNFVEDSAIKAEMDKRVSVTGVRGLIVKTWQGLVRFISGTKVNEPEKINDSKRSVSEIIGMLNADSVVSVYLKRNAGFPALFGYATAPDGKQSFVPMRIKTKILDAEVGIHMFLKVGDFHKFIEKFMLERNSVNFIDIQNELSVYVKNILQDELKDENFDAYGISQGAIDRINGKLAEIPVYEECGIVFVRVAEVTCNSEELDRFRKLSQELWCSENELDYLHRVNEFKNRLARENNAKAIDDARSEVELKDELRNINRDRLLSEDEFEAFTTALALRKFNRANDAEIEQLLGKTNIASAQLASRTRLALEKLDADEKICMRSVEMQKQSLRDSQELNKIGLDIRRQNDDYGDERREKDFSFDVRKLEVALDIDEKMNEQEQRNADREEARKRAALEQQRIISQEQHRHEETIAAIHKEYTAEQLVAENIARLDSVAQVEFARTFGSKKEEEAAKATRQVYEDAIAKHEQERKDMMNLLQNLAETNAAVAGAQISKAEQYKNEYRDDARYQQTRIDHTQDKALEYTTRSASVVPKYTKAVCPVCGEPINEKEKFCPGCGRKFE